MSQSIEIVKIVELSRRAGEAILAIYNDVDQVEIKIKSDQSPVTNADLAAHRIISEGLTALTPDIPILSEESIEQADFDQRREWSRFWLVDPLDGTKEFIHRNGEFTVNIALIENNEPVLGVIHVPVMNVSYYADRVNGAFKQVGEKESVSLPLSGNAHSGKRVAVSRSHISEITLEYLDQLGEPDELEQVPVGSSLKFCLIAEGSIDIYPRLGPTMEWDTAAGQAIVEAAGKHVRTYDSEQRLSYNKPDLLNPFFVVQ